MKAECARCDSASDAVAASQKDGEVSSPCASNTGAKSGALKVRSSSAARADAHTQAPKVSFFGPSVFFAPLLLFCLTFVDADLGNASPADLQRELSRFSNSPEATGLTSSVLFVPLNGDLTGSVQSNPNLLVVPASVTKLVTALVALEELGPDHTFETRVSRQGTIDDRGVLSGSLIIEGEGDPFLVSERLWLLVRQLQQQGIRRVEGGIILDPTGLPWTDPSVDQVAGGSNRSYAALPSILAANFNSVAVRIVPGAKAEDPITVTGDPFGIRYLEIDNRLKTGPPGSSPRWHFEMESTAEGLAFEPLLEQGQLRWIGNGVPLERATLQGTIPVGTKPFLAYRRARYPLVHFGSLFREFLEDAGIEVEGPVRIDSDAGARTLLTEFRSPPLQDLLTSMNRYSNNFIANQIALAVAEELTERDDPLAEPLGSSEADLGGGVPVMTARPARLAEAGGMLARWLVQNSGANERIYLEDGSGLSPANRLSADSMVKLLTRGWNDFNLLPKLLFTLPGPRGIGTLRNRFGGRAPAPDLWAKTGTFYDARVSSLAGYFHAPSGPVAFAILLDGADGTKWNVDRMHTLQEYWIDLYLK